MTCFTTDSPRLKAFLMATCAVVLGTCAAWWLAVRLARPEGDPGWPDGKHPAAEIHQGPWGTMEALRLPLVNPGGTIPNLEERLQEPRWFFDCASRERVTQFLETCDLTLSQKGSLLNSAFWSVTSNGCLLRPRASVVRSLAPEARGRIYGLLARNPANYPQCHPLLFPTNIFEQCLAAGGLSGQAIATLRDLAYPVQRHLAVADFYLARGLLPKRDFDRLLSFLHQTPSYRLRLHLAADSDTEALARYWGRGGRTNLIQPLLASAARVPMGTWVNVSALLPPFPRLHLYTFPECWDDPTAGEQDCLYSALNFFASTPDTNLLDRTLAGRVLLEAYTPSEGPPHYGDLVLLLDSSGKMFHAAVFIAADFVFTKNGINLSQPWSVMKMKDLLFLYYGPNVAPHVTYARHKSHFQQPIERIGSR